jgi:hypothetical protein
MDKTPYVHNYTDELEALPFLARGSNAVVFHTIGLLLPTYPDGTDAETISKFTAVTERTVRATLVLLKHSGLIAETSDGKYIPVKYIEYRKPGAYNAHPGMNQSIDFQSNKSIQSSKLFTENDFGIAYNALETLLILGGGGLSPIDREAFKELWTEYPDPALHQRARDITKKRAARPNYKYYERVVQTGAIEYDAKENKAELIEVLL